MVSRITQFLSQAPYWLAAGVIALVPLAFYPAGGAVVNGKVIVLSVLTALLLLIAAFQSYSRGSSERVPMLAYVAWLIPVAYIISAILSNEQARSFVGTGIESTTAVAMILFTAAMTAVSLAVSRNRLEQFLMIFSGVGAFVALLQFARLIIGTGSITFGGALASTTATLLGSSHDLGAYLAVVAVVSAYLHLRGSESRTRMVGMVSLVLSLILLVIINAFDIWVGLGLASALLVANAWFRGAPEARMRSAAVYGAITVVAVIGMALGATIVSVLPQSMQLTEIDVRPSFSGTMTVAQGVMKNGGTFFGSGPNTFAQSWGAYKPLATNDTLFWNVDFPSGVSFVPTAIVETGILGALAWIAFFALFAYMGYRRERRDPSEMFTVLFLSAVLLWALHFVYTPGYAVTALAFVVSGFVLVFAKGAQSEEGMMSQNTEGLTMIQRIIPALGMLAFAVVTVTGGYLAVRGVLADVMVRQSVASFATSNDVAGTSGMLARAEALAVQKDVVHRAEAELALVGLLQAAAKTPNTEQDKAAQVAVIQTNANAAIAHAQAAIVFDKADYRNWLSLAQAYESLAQFGVQGAADNARQAYLQVAAAHPQNPFPFLRLALITGGTPGANPQQVLGYLSQAVALKPTYAPAFFLGSQVALAVGSTTEAVNAAFAAAQNAPNDPLAWFWLGALLLRANDTKDAIVALERATTIYPDYANALYLLGVAYSRESRPQDALRVLDRLNQLNPNNPDIAQAIANVKAGQPVLGGQ